MSMSPRSMLPLMIGQASRRPAAVLATRLGIWMHVARHGWIGTTVDLPFMFG
jgi:hypothetical protein